MRSLVILIFFSILLSCSRQNQQENSTETSSTEPEAVSFSGKPLFSKPAEAGALAKSDSLIAALTLKNQLSEDDFVEIGKQLVATARYKRAVENYTLGIGKYPRSYKLLRNRGHRYITLRKLDLALADLTRAEELIRTEPDVMEYGLDGKPTATVRHQIWYHLGVYYYLTRDYPQAAAAFEKALSTAGDAKNIVGASDWLYNSYERMGEPEKANQIIKPVDESYLDDKEQPYFRRILLYKGIISPEQLIDVNKSPEQMSVQDITKLYGLANWYGYNGHPEKAQELYKTILKSDAWPGFAYAAAEKDISGN